MAGRKDHVEGEPNAHGDASAAPLPFHRPSLLPKNLEGTLRHLNDSELARLLSATIAEHDRRGLTRLDGGQLEPVREEGARKEEPATPMPGIEGLTQAQVNLVQAAFKAGVKPSAIARQFGISLKVIQKALARKAR